MLDLEAGRLVELSDRISADAQAYELAYVLKNLATGVEKFEELEQGHCDEDFWRVRNAAYLAGRVQATDAIPMLQKLQESSYCGSSTTGGIGMFEEFEGEVNPHSYSTFSLRQVVHLSLRRLGETPKPLPIYAFDVEHEAYEKDFPYRLKALGAPRSENVGKVVKGMKAEQVLDLIGSPDEIGYAKWEYDIDGAEPFTLVVSWDVRTVTDVLKVKPVRWKDGFVRDEGIVR